MRKFWNNKELVIAVAKSKNITDVLRSIGLRAAGGNFKTIHRYIKDLKIDTSHFETTSERGKRIGLVRKKDIRFYLVENNHTVNSASLKERLFEEGLKKRECEECGQGETWRGKRMSLILDHKNGIHSDYRLENLRIACPNCNSTFPTHCGKNKAKRKCVDCSIKITHKGKYCRGCYQKYNTGGGNKIPERPSYQELKLKVEQYGYCAVGRMYGVSDNAIRKWIRKYEMKN
jgi:Zn finger protein HypA/HybF involved in hydrogenase expression